MLQSLLRNKLGEHEFSMHIHLMNAINTISIGLRRLNGASTPICVQCTMLNAHYCE